MQLLLNCAIKRFKDQISEQIFKTKSSFEGRTFAFLIPYNCTKPYLLWTNPYSEIIANIYKSKEKVKNSCLLIRYLIGSNLMSA